METTDKIYCIPGDRFPANFLLSALADANADLPDYAPKAVVVIPDLSGTLPDKFRTALVDLTPRQAYMLSTSVVYGEEYTDASEDAAAPVTDEARNWLRAEEEFAGLCHQHNVIATIFRLPLLIGTGMTGEMRRRINAIHRGLYRHIQGVDAHQSVLHARDLPALIVQLRGIGGIYNVSDRTDPTTHEIAEALSARMGAKRIYTVNAKWARLAARLADIFGIKDLGTASLQSVTATRTLSTRRLDNIICKVEPSTEDQTQTGSQSLSDNSDEKQNNNSQENSPGLADWHPTNTLSYLHTHTYSPLDP